MQGCVGKGIGKGSILHARADPFAFQFEVPFCQLIGLFDIHHGRVLRFDIGVLLGQNMPILTEEFFCQRVDKWAQG